MAFGQAMKPTNLYNQKLQQVSYEIVGLVILRLPRPLPGHAPEVTLTLLRAASRPPPGRPPRHSLAAPWPHPGPPQAALPAAPVAHRPTDWATDYINKLPINRTAAVMV